MVSLVLGKTIIHAREQVWASLLESPCCSGVNTVTGAKETRFGVGLLRTNAFPVSESDTRDVKGTAGGTNEVMPSDSVSERIVTEGKLRGLFGLLGYREGREREALEVDRLDMVS